MEHEKKKKEKEEQWTAYWAPKMCMDDGTRSEIEIRWCEMREKKLWWRHTFGEEYVPAVEPEHPGAAGEEARNEEEQKVLR